VIASIPPPTYGPDDPEDGNVDTKTLALCQLGQALAEAHRWQEASMACQKAQELVVPMMDSLWRDEMLSKISQVLAKPHRWQEVQEVIASIVSDREKVAAMKELGATLTQIWLQIREASITSQHKFSHAVKSAQVKADAYLQLLGFLQQVWLRLTTYDEVFPALSIVHGLILLKPALGSDFFKAIDWVDIFLKGVDETSLEGSSPSPKAYASRDLLFDV
jgi:hypothetical protein